MAYNNIINKIPVVVDIHGYKNLYDAKYLLKIKENEFFKGFITLNNFLKEKYIRLGFPNNKILVTDNVIDLNKFNLINNDKIELRKRLNIPINKNIIIYSGSILDDRGIDTIIHSSEFFNPRDYSFFFIGGIEEDIKKWEKYIQENKINSDIRFLGLKERRVIPYYLKAADILLATFSTNCPTLDFMSPIKIFEYMASKTPFIATKIGRNIEICNNNECLFTTVEDPVDLSEKIKILMNDKNLRLKLIENSYAKAKNHTFERKCRLILDLL